jgi:hypothetical protein
LHRAERPTLKKKRGKGIKIAIEKYIVAMPGLTLEVNGDHDHAGVKCLDGIGKLEAMIGVKLIGEALAELNFGREDEVGVEEFESDTEFVTKVDGADLQELIGAMRAGICGKVVIEFATGETVEPEGGGK